MTIPCANCGGAAAEVSLIPASGKSITEGLWQDRDRLERTEFIRHVYRFAPYEKLVDLFEAIAYNNWELARSLDPHFVAFVCRLCDEPYCDMCWSLSPSAAQESEGDLAWGECPHEHVQIVDE
ncbi:MAG: hypothetical protein U0528_15870 [Anaerolineae bacterium]|nr:hypothetical protein [Anaerolineae bacterium]